MARSQPNSRPLSLLLALPGDDDFGLHSALLSGDETRPQASFFFLISIHLTGSAGFLLVG